MKYFLYILTLVFTACLTDNMDPEKYPQKWQLVEMSGNIVNVSPSTGSDMAWQEYYILYDDNTFVKSRNRRNTINEEAGTFSFIDLSDGQYLELAYESDNDIIGNCSSEFKELLKLTSEYELVGTWLACDGPGLVYKRVD